MDPPDSASRVFCSRILSMVNTDDVNAIILAQKNMLDRFEKTNEMLLNFNSLSSARLQQMSERFLHHTRTLVEMKRDLDSIFRRIRTLKGKLARQHPEAFSQMWPWGPSRTPWSKPSHLGKEFNGIFLYPMFTDAVEKLSIKRLINKKGSLHPAVASFHPWALVPRRCTSAEYGAGDQAPLR
ncbi:kxDL motif-containing protein 1 isoform X1 [Cynocephalus volans]|uniref:kxDL motif-containing protein 1 isoform X1 n=1 Tax=Cynocephalus volans TaxID=110931 RepID=UPI002FCC2483